MADRFPLIVNPSTGRIQELAAGDNLNLTSNSIVGATTVTASTFVGNLTGTSDIAISLTDAGNILSGTIDSARLDGYYNIGVATALILADAANIETGTIDPARLTGDYDINITGVAHDATNLISAENILDGIIDVNRLAGTYNINITGTAFNAIGAANSVSVVATDDFDTYYIPFFKFYDTDDTPQVDDTSLVYNPGQNRLGIGSTAPTVSLDVIGDINASGYGRYSTLQSTNLTVSGITTSQFIRSVLINNTGIATVGSISIGSTQVVSSLRQLQNILSIDATTKSTLETALELEPNNFNSLNVSGIGTFSGILKANGGLDVFGHTDLDTVTVASAATITSATITSTNTQTLVVSAGSSVGSLSIGSTQVISQSRGLQNISSIDETTRLTIESALQLEPNNFNSLNVSGIGTFGGRLNLNSGLQVVGQTTLENLNVSGLGTITTINNTNTNVSGIATISTVISTNTSVSGTSTVATLNATTASISSASITQSTIGNVQVSGAATISGSVDIDSGLDVTGQTELDNVNAGIVTATSIYGNGANIVGIVTQIAAGIGVDLVSSQSSGKGVVKVSSYKPIGKTIFVSQTGSDSNTGLSENHPKRTIKAAAQVAVFGDTIKVYPGVYVEENPVVLKKTVSVEGTELRNCVVTPKYPYLDLFHVNNGCHITDVSFIGPDMTDGASVIALQPLEGVAVDRYFDAARMIRLNLDYIARESVGFLTSGFSGFAGGHREQDAAKLIDKNLNYIAAEAVGFLTSPTGYNFTLSGGDYTNCKEDIVSIMSAVSYDLKANSNRKSVGAALSYFNSSGGLIHITGIATQQATIAALDYAVGIAKSVINNVVPLISYQSGIGSIAQVIDPSVIAVSGGCVGVGTTIAQLVGIVTQAIGAASTSGLPAIRFGVTLESADCTDDVKDIWKCIIHDITRGGNSRCVAAGKSYYDADWNLIPQILKNPGEVKQSVATIDYSFNVARAIVNNVTWGGYPVGLGTVVSNAVYDEITGVTRITAPNHGLSKDDAVRITGLGFTCPSGPGIVTYPSGSLGYIFNVNSVIGVNTFEVVVGQSTLPHTYVSGGTVQKYTSFQNNFTQVKDLGMQKDPLTGFNNAINGCANVISAMRSCVGVVTSVVGFGSTAFSSVGIRTTYPGNSGIGFTTVLGITSAVYDETTGKTTIIAPGLNFIEGEPIEIRGLNFSCSSGGGISTQSFPSGKYGFDFFIDKVNTDGSFEVYVGPSTLPHTYVGGGVIVDRAVGVTTASYVHTTGITTIKATGLSIETGDLVKIRGLEFSCPSGSGTTTIYPTGNNGYEFRVLDIVTDKPYGITSAVYNHTTGITTITAPGIGVTFNDIIELRNLEFSCPSGAGTTTIYPTGNNGYDFRVLSSIGSTFTVNVGPSTIPHTYVSGGTAVNITKTAGDTFTINVGPSTIPHTYVRGGIAIPPFSRGVGPITQGPYVRNCTNFIPKSIGMKVDGFAAEPGDQDDIGVTGTMSVDSYTQYNQGGIGVSITNGAYAQLVSIFTICDDIAIFTGSGGQCDITNSNSSFGRLGLFSDGVGDAGTKSIYRSTGVAATTAPEKTNQVVVSGVGNYRPYDGQVCYFGELYYFVDTIQVTNGGSGYTVSPRVNISFPEGANGITAQATATVENGSVVSVNIVNSGTQYSKPPIITIDPPPSGTQATARASNMQPIYYKVSAATLPSAGISTISFLQTLNNTVSAGTTVYFSRTSLQLATTISFEFVGAGTNINTAKPALGGVVVPENQVVQTNGGSVVYTSTDQAGNFKIGDGVVINQATGQISGRDFTKALFVTLTPFILALAD